jgi:hypothetical protein
MFYNTVIIIINNNNKKKFYILCLLYFIVIIYYYYYCIYIQYLNRMNITSRLQCRIVSIRFCGSNMKITKMCIRVKSKDYVAKELIGIIFASVYYCS